MKVNVIKLIAAFFVVISTGLLVLNDFKYNSYVFVFNVIGIMLFVYALIKDAKSSK
jgi:hypothetical protein